MLTPTPCGSFHLRVNCCINYVGFGRLNQMKEFSPHRLTKRQGHRGYNAGMEEALHPLEAEAAEMKADEGRN
ncbi:hypothetical protein SLA2020_204910 [Shorea laevis]